MRGMITCVVASPALMHLGCQEYWSSIQPVLHSQRFRILVGIQAWPTMSESNVGFFAVGVATEPPPGLEHMAVGVPVTYWWLVRYIYMCIHKQANRYIDIHI